jgi:hypothetical protein
MLIRRQDPYEIGKGMKGSVSLLSTAVNSVEHRFGINIKMITASLWQIGKLPKLIDVMQQIKWTCAAFLLKSSSVSSSGEKNVEHLGDFLC